MAIAAGSVASGHQVGGSRGLPGLNHLFQQAETGHPNEYHAIEETWSVEVMELIAAWILRTVGGRGR